MKKLIAVLLMITLLASLSVCAFAADPSPSQGGDVPAAGGGTQPTDDDKDEEPTQEVEEIAAPDPEDVTGQDEDGNDADVVVGDEDVPEDADEETKKAVEEAKDQKQNAKDSLTPENINKAISGDKDMKDKAEGKNFKASTPMMVYSPTNTYPMRVTIPVEDLDTFITALIFANGSWEIPESQELDEEESTDSFLIWGPCYFTAVYAGDEVAAP